MAITEDSRIQVLDEVLAAELTSLYSTLEVFLDDPTYSEAKKIKIETLLQDLKDDIFSINQTLILKAYRSNVLEKSNTTAYTPSADYHPMTLKYFKEHSENLSINITGAWSGFTINHIAGRRCGNRFTINSKVYSSSTSSNYQLIGVIDGYVSPGSYFYFSASPRNPEIYQSANGYIDTSGNIYLKTGKSGQEFVFNISIIS